MLRLMCSQSSWKGRGSSAGICARQGAAPASSASSGNSAPTSYADRRGCCTGTATASPTSRARSCRSSIWLRSRQSRTRSAHRFDPLRFRGNLYVAGWPAWHEFALLDREIGVGAAARVKTVKRIRRCAATEVDPRTAARDLPIPGTLLQRFGHGDCGVYAEVTAAGEIAPGDAVAEG